MTHQHTSRPSPVKQRLYRGLSGLWAPWQNIDDTPATQTLSPAGLALFRRMSAADRAHSLRVHAWLRARGHDAPALLAAGLLHDCGKAAARLAVWQRTLKVILRKFAPGLWHKLAAPASPPNWRYPFFVLAEHTRIGAEWAQQAGCAQDVVWLIAHHEDIILPDHPASPWLQLLQDADASN